MESHQIMVKGNCFGFPRSKADNMFGRQSPPSGALTDFKLNGVRLMNFKSYKYRKLNGFEEKFVCSVLSDINSIIKKWHGIFPNIKFVKVKQHLFDSPSELPVANDAHRAELAADVEIIANLRQPHQQLGNRTVDNAVLEGYCGIVYHFASSWFKSDINGITKNDIMQELYLKIWEIMYRWNSDRGSLSTFIWKSVQNRIYTVLNTQGRPLGHLRTTGLLLMAKFDKLRKAMPNSDTSEIIDSMDLTAKKKQHLLDILASVKLNSQMQNSGQNSDSYGDDYSVLGNIPKKTENDELTQKIYVKDILDKSNLTLNERKLIDASMEPYHGWQTDMASKIVSEKTGKKYTKMRITQILQKAREKVANTIEQQRAVENGA
jgi:RNA polymerase sigma factor (sigma-70 family)